MSVNGSGDGTELARQFQDELGGGQSAADSAGGERRGDETAGRSEASTAARPAAVPDIGITGTSSSQEGKELEGGGGLDRLEVKVYGSWLASHYEKQMVTIYLAHLDLRLFSEFCPDLWQGSLLIAEYGYS